MTEEVKEHLPTSIFVNSFVHLGTHHAHTLLYPRFTWTMLGIFFTNHSTAMDKTQIVSCWFSKTISTTWTVFTCSLSARMKCAIIMMNAHQLLNSLHPLTTWYSLSTPSPNTNINLQWNAMVKMLCLYKLTQHKVFCITEFPLTLRLHVNLSPKQHDYLNVAPLSSSDRAS